MCFTILYSDGVLTRRRVCFVFSSVIVSAASVEVQPFPSEIPFPAMFGGIMSLGLDVHMRADGEKTYSGIIPILVGSITSWISNKKSP